MESATTSPSSLSETFEKLTANPAFTAIGLGVILVIFLTILLYFLLRRQPKKVLAYATENGRVMVSRAAIVELVQTSCAQLNDVSKPRVKLVVRRKVTNLDVDIKLLSGGRLRQIEDTLQAHLRLVLSENLGIENLGYINIIATGFKSGRIDQTTTVNRLEDTTVDLDNDSIDTESDTVNTNNETK